MRMRAFAELLTYIHEKDLMSEAAPVLGAHAVFARSGTGEVGAQDLDGDQPLERLFASQKDGGHPALSQQANQLVVGGEGGGDPVEER